MSKERKVEGRYDLEGAVSILISNIVDGVPAIRVGSNNSSVSVAALLPGAVDVGVAEAEVLVFVLAVVLGGGDGGDSSSSFSNNSRSNSSNSRGGSSSDLSNRGNNIPDQRSSNSSNNRLSDSNSGSQKRSMVTSIGIGSSSVSISGVESISLGVTRCQSCQGQHDLKKSSQC